MRDGNAKPGYFSQLSGKIDLTIREIITIVRFAMLRLTVDEIVGRESSVKVLCRNPQDDYPEHSHDFSELVLVSSGSGTHIVNGVQKMVLPNTIACLSERDYHQYTDSNNLILYNIVYNKHKLNLGEQAVEVVKTLESEPTNVLVSHTVFQPMLAIMQNIRQEQEQDRKHANTMVSLMFEQLLLMLDRQWMVRVNHSPVMNAIMYLINHYDEQDLSVNQLCDSFRVSSRALSQKLLQLTGVSTNRFIHQLRIRKAIGLIGSGAPITAVAYRVGYNDSNYFSTKFKLVTGKTPREYRHSQCGLVD
jgi:AraC family L-rhamnose operon regulatory protein RhaS